MNFYPGFDIEPTTRPLGFEYGFEYDAIRSHNGLACFPVISENGEIEWEKNPNYLDSGLTIKNPEIYIQLGIKSGKSIYSQFEENAGRFMFVPQPQLAKEVWKKFIP